MQVTSKEEKRIGGQGRSAVGADGFTPFNASR